MVSSLLPEFPGNRLDTIVEGGGKVQMEALDLLKRAFSAYVQSKGDVVRAVVRYFEGFAGVEAFFHANGSCKPFVELVVSVLLPVRFAPCTPTSHTSRPAPPLIHTRALFSHPPTRTHSARSTTAA